MGGGGAKHRRGLPAGGRGPGWGSWHCRPGSARRLEGDWLDAQTAEALLGCYGIESKGAVVADVKIRVEPVPRRLSPLLREL
jgi:hypothetical protein